MSKPTESKFPVMSEEVLERCIKDFEKGNLKEFESLSPEGREMVRQILSDSLSGDDALREELYAVDYDNRRVSPEVFFTHPDYFGHFRESIHEAWWDHLLKICDPSNHIFEVILTGALGIGKSTVGTGLIMGYHLHRLLCLKDPAAFFGLGKKSQIICGLYSVDLRSAEGIGFYILRDQMMGESPFFQEIYRRSPFGVDRILLPKGIEVLTGSESLRVLGRNVFMLALDEANFKGKSGVTAGKKAFAFANEISQRLATRFLQKGGDNPGVVVYMGSAGSETDFIEKRLKRVRGKRGHYCVRGALWEFKNKTPENEPLYCGENFKVQVGTRDVASKIMERVEKDGREYKREKLQDLEEGCACVDVPVELFDLFEVDVDSALRNLAGMSTVSYMKFFSDVERVNKVFTDDLPQAFGKEIIGAYLLCGTELAHAFRVNQMCRVRRSRYQPLRSPNAPRYIHIDLAKNKDRAGIAMVHPSRYQVITRDEEGEGIVDIKKEVEVDFAVALTCGPKKEPIDFANIRRLIFFLRESGFRIRLVTTDSWQSEDTHQRLIEAKIPIETLSMDTTSRPYSVFRYSVYSDCVRIPKNTLLRGEMIDLDYDEETDKIDHPPGGSKDVADAVGGAVCKCLMDKTRQTLEEETPCGKDPLRGFLERMKNFVERREHEIV